MTEVHPICKLIEVLLSGANVAGIREYLDSYECCAFCKNRGTHDGCCDVDERNQFDDCVCGYYGRSAVGDDFYRKFLNREWYK